MIITLREVTEDDLPIFFSQQLDAEATAMAALKMAAAFLVVLSQNMGGCYRGHFGKAMVVKMSVLRRMQTTRSGAEVDVHPLRVCGIGRNAIP